MTQTDIERIAHLDFDISHEKEESCDGVVMMRNPKSGGGRIDEDTCGKAAKFYGIRRCCGHVDSLCKDHLNVVALPEENLRNCRFCWNIRTIPVFSSVESIK